MKADTDSYLIGQRSDDIGQSSERSDAQRRFARAAGSGREASGGEGFRAQARLAAGRYA
jgi:hypothetical protein